jgi:heterodisulfide reductase subunit B
MKLAYYPGCTLKTTGKAFEASAIASTEALGISLVEPDRWNCCGTVHSLTKDDVMHHLAPVRNLLRVEQMQEAGTVDEKRVVTLCDMCYNTLKRTNGLFNQNADLAGKVAENFSNEEHAYGGGVQVEHMLETLRGLGWDAVKNRVKNPLKGLKVAPYYGCLLLRPRGIGIDDADHPTVLEDLIKALGGEVADYPFKLKCCGSYHTVNMKEVVADLSGRILKQAREAGADIVATACPLCQFNLGDRQAEVRKKNPAFQDVPVVYFTQLMALAFGLGEETHAFGENKPDPRPLLRSKGLIQE